MAIHGDGKVESIEVQRNRIERDDSGALRARPADDATETIECDLVLRSVGYRAVPLPDVPFDERNYVLPNEQGRVVDAGSRDAVPGVYAVGWIKRGPDRDPGHEQARRQRDRRAAAGGPGLAPGARGARRSMPSTRCWPRRRRRW